MQLVDLGRHDHAAAAAEDLDVRAAAAAQQVDHVLEELDVPALVAADRDALGILNEQVRGCKRILDRLVAGDLPLDLRSDRAAQPDVVARAGQQGAGPQVRRCRGAGRECEVVERDAMARRQRGMVVVVGHDGRDVHRQLAALPAKQQVVQAVAVLADHQQQPRALVHRVKACLHAELAAHVCEQVFQHRRVGQLRRRGRK